MNDKDNLLEILQNNGDLNDVKPKSNAQLTELQLAELKDLREENKVLTRDCLRLTKSNDKLRKRLKRMAEYKRLLKVMALRRQRLKTDK